MPALGDSSIAVLPVQNASRPQGHGVRAACGSRCARLITAQRGWTWACPRNAAPTGFSITGVGVGWRIRHRHRQRQGACAQHLVQRMCALLERRAAALLASRPLRLRNTRVASIALPSSFRLSLLGAVAHQLDRSVQGRVAARTRDRPADVRTWVTSSLDSDHVQAAPRTLRDENRHPFPQQQTVFDPPAHRGRAQAWAHGAHPRPAALLHAYRRRWLQPALQGQADHRIRRSAPAHRRLGHALCHGGVAPARIHGQLHAQSLRRHPALARQVARASTAGRPGH